MIKKFKEKIKKSTNFERIIIVCAIFMLIMLFVGVIFRLIGFEQFIIDKKANISIDIKYKRLIDSILLFINTIFFLLFALKEYSINFTKRAIFLFPIIYFINNFNNRTEYIIAMFILPFVITFLIKFDWKTVKRSLFIMIIVSSIQLVSGFVKSYIFSIDIPNNSSDSLLNIIYNLDIYLNCIIIILISKYEVIKVEFKFMVFLGKIRQMLFKIKDSNNELL